MSIRGRAVHFFVNRIAPGAILQSRVLPTASGDLVFLGDGLSLHGEWGEWFPTESVRAIGDETLLIADAHEFVAAIEAPRALVLMLGTADLLGMGGSGSPAQAAQRLDALVALATSRFGAKAVVVVGVPLRPVLGIRAAAFNSKLASLVVARGATFVPAPAFAGDAADGYLLSAIRWDAAVYAELAQPVGDAIGVPVAVGTAPRPLTGEVKGLVVRAQHKRAQLFEVLPRPTGRVILYGDSITEGGFWDGWLPGMPVANRGIGGDTVAELAARIDTAIESPLAVSLLAGTNDLQRGEPRDAVSIAGRFRELVAQIRERDAKVPIVINSVMPRAAKFADDITTINALYREIATEFDAHYLDLWPVLATPARALRKELTRDGLHLNAEGYRAWVGLLRPALEAAIG